MDSGKILDQLNFVLKFISTTPFEKGGMTFEFILKKVQSNIPDGNELKKILDKLSKDGHIDFEDKIVNSYDMNSKYPYIDEKTIRYYFANIEGRLFSTNENGGYPKSNNRRNLRYTNEQINLMDKVFTYILDKHISDKRQIAEAFNIELDLAQFIINQICENGHELGILTSQKLGYGNSFIVKIDKIKCQNFRNQGGFKAHFEMGENKSLSIQKNITITGDGNIVNQDSDLRDSPITYNHTTTFSTKKNAHKIKSWYETPLFKYLIWPILTGLLILLLGWYLTNNKPTLSKSVPTKDTLKKVRK